MGILLGQLPPAEVARLKAELAETLIANFCYPRFFDYRTSSLRMRPVDRSKRQEVWLFLSSVDFTSWSRVDLMSPDFQRQIERLFIHFVQRNRNFFGEQGRKRMADVRMLISSAATSVTEGLRSHLKGHQQSNPSFGSPRPVSSWSITNATSRPEASWEQVVSRTMLIQQQLQDMRGEIKAPTAGNATITSEARPATTRRSTRARPIDNGTSSAEREVPAPATPNISANKLVVQTDGRAHTHTAPAPGPKTTAPLYPPMDSVTAPPPTSASPASPASPARKVEPIVLPADVPVPPAPQVPPVPVKTPGKSTGAETSAAPHIPEQAQPPATPQLVQTRSLSQAPQAPLTGVTAGKSESATVLVSDEDVVIFEQMRHQLVVWLRIEAVRAGVDISGQGPVQLLQLLRREESVEDTRLQVVSTLLNISNQVITNGHATLLDYKQAMMFYLMHARHP